ncbi:MAG TPA: response regulator transcription factor, partial [Chthonomonadales bacterium]|nr:response regulator transcription factor [Chthonomonadales bacterium]
MSVLWRLERSLLPDNGKGTCLAGIGVALADGHALVRQALCALLRNRAGLYVVVEAGSVTEAMASASVAPVDLVVYDPCTVPDGGREAMGRICRGAPALRLVVLTGDSRESSVRDALCAGARAYALKSSGLDALLTALREASAGRYWFDAAITRRDPEAYAAELCSAHDDPCRRLTAREREVMRLVAA